MRTRVPASAEPLLVGRQREVASLWRQFEAAADGRTVVAFVAGEPGIGKTRLLDVVGARAQSAGAIVLRGGASAAEGMPPYLPFLEALGQHIRATSADDLREQVGALASVLATILPELTYRLGELPASYPLPAEQARLRIYQAVSAFLAAIAAARPLIFVLDDLQWADPASLDLLCYVARHQPDARLVVLGAYRDGEVDQNPAFGRAIAELNRLRVLTTVAVGPLTTGEVAALGAGYLGAPIDPAVRDLLFAHSEGNPFFAEELLCVWLESGALIQKSPARENSYWELISSVAPALPPSIVSAVGQRLARLSPDVVDVLRTAAIIGRAFDVTTLAGVAGQDPELVEGHLRQAERVRLIREGEAGTFSFGHDKIRECLYADLTAVRRQRLHGFIGRVLEARADPVSAQRLAELAFHFARSGDRERGVTYAQRAAAHAMRTFAPNEAVNHYRAALGLIGAEDPRRGELLLGRGEAAVLAGLEQDAVTAFEAAQAWFEQAWDSQSAALAAYRLGLAWWRQEEIHRARSALESSLALLEGRREPQMVRVLVDLGTLLGVSLHEQTAGIAHCQRALERAQDLRDDRLVVAATRALGNLLVRNNQLAEGTSLLERALALATEMDDPVEGAECCGCLAPAYFWRGAMRRCRDVVLQRLAFAQRCHDPYELRHVYTWLAVTSGLQGKLSESSEMLDRAQAIVDRLASPEPRAYVEFCRGALAHNRGEYAEAEAWLQQAIDVFGGIGSGALVWYLGFLGLAQAAQGKAVEARACLDELEALLLGMPSGTTPPVEPLAYLVEIALMLGDRERLARYYPNLAAFHGQFHDMLVDRLLGKIETLQGDWPAARMHLEAAEETARREDLLYELAHTLESQANLARAEGGRGAAERARDLLARALEVFQGLGNQTEARRIRERLRTQTRRQPDRPRLPAGLSVREVEVLRLVAAGKSNREIAAELVLSEKTVENHLSNVYGKIGADNRAAATAFALRHDLA